MKEYKKPSLKAMNMMIGCELLVDSVNGNAFNGSPQPSNGTVTPRSRQHSVWDSDDEDWDN